MKKGSSIKNLSLVIAALLTAIAFVKCTKQGTAAAALNRTVAADAIDSTAFSPFYDSTLVPYADVIPDANDYIIKKGVLSIIKKNCANAGCHGGKISPALNSYAAVKSLVTAGSPEASKLWRLITTNDLNEAMPPVGTLNEMPLTEKNIIYTWIKNGAKENPDIADYRPAAIRLITNGCTSANCHSMPSVTGSWAKSGLLGVVAATDTATVKYTTPSGSALSYTEIVNPTLMASVWQGYEDSCYNYYPSITAIAASSTAPVNAAFKSKRIGAGLSPHGPFSTYDAILLDVIIPKTIRINSGTDYLNSTSSLFGRVDSTIVFKNPRTGLWAASQNASMTYNDGGFGKADIPVIKAWYFSDPNIPDVWKFGINNSGIFKFRKSGNIITKH